MKADLKRLSIRSVNVVSMEQLIELKDHTRLSLALLIEEVIDLLWG